MRICAWGFVIYCYLPLRPRAQQFLRLASSHQTTKPLNH